MAPFYHMMAVMSNWLVRRGVNRRAAEDYTRELFLALSQDSIFKNKLSLKQLVSRSQTPGGINAQALRELKKKEILQNPTKSFK